LTGSPGPVAGGVSAYGFRTSSDPQLNLNNGQAAVPTLFFSSPTGAFTQSGGTITVNIAGVYAVDVKITSDIQGQEGFSLRINGTITPGTTVELGSATQAGFSTIVNLNAGDIVSVNAIVTLLGTVNLSSSGLPDNHQNFTITLVKLDLP
jgi:hypothetical protein